MPTAIWKGNPERELGPRMEVSVQEEDAVRESGAETNKKCAPPNLKESVPFQDLGSTIRNSSLTPYQGALLDS